MSGLASQGWPGHAITPAQASPRAEQAETLVFAVEDKSGYWRVQLLDDMLVYEHRAGGTVLERRETESSDREWRRFWVSIDRVGVWSWADGFRGAEDGDRWLLQLARKDRRIQSSGMGAFPPVSDPSPSNDFLRLCAAMARLVGEIVLPPS
jgi:hypothetical protein